MLSKEQDLHNLFTLDPKPNQDLEKCTLRDALFVTVKNKKFTFGETFEKFGIFDSPELHGIRLRVEFDRFTDLILEKDFDLFGIECFKTKEYKPVTFRTKTVAHSKREVDNHGITYDVVDSICVVLPEDFIQFVGREVEIVVKVIG
jgi:hypothetical protein